MDEDRTSGAGEPDAGDSYVAGQEPQRVVFVWLCQWAVRIRLSLGWQQV